MSSRVISFHYTLKDKSGKTLESSHKHDPVMYIEGGGQILPGLEKNLTDAKKGEKRQVHLKPEDAYGNYDKNLIVTVPISQLPGNEPIKKGGQFRSETPEGHTKVFVVTDITATDVTLDGNHPLVDQDLTFEIEVVEIRKATDEEMAHGHVHGPHTHH